MTTLDILSIPLKGVQLIEAGAGTGKTYTITNLYVRLILETGVSPDSILVVTFTNAATEELTERIRRRLRDARRTATGDTGSDTFLMKVLERVGDRPLAIHRLDDALAGFDQAAICTIHGFCHRALRDHAFETGIPFDMELVSDPSSLLMDIAADFWRTHVYDVPSELAAYLLARTHGPSYFSELIKTSHLAGVTVLPEPRRPELTHLDDFRHLFSTLRQDWPAARQTITRCLMDPSLKGNVYGSLRPSADVHVTPRQMKVNALVAAMDRFTGSDPPGWPIPSELEKLTTGKITASTRKTASPPTHGFFELCQRFWRTSHHLGEEMEAYHRFLKTVFIPYAQKTIKARKQKRNILFYEDLLVRLEDVLVKEQTNGRPRLAEQIGHRYRAALVDEFQDTDFIQYSIFSKLFDADDTLLCMIGDPKQAIYGFRGADVYSYLSAARRADERHTLTCNWRSSDGLIHAVNTLFSNVDDPFVFQDIAFLPGESAPISLDNPFQATSSLMMWLLPHPPGKRLAKGKAVDVLVKAVTHETSRLIGTGIPPGDIAVLVRTHRQARLVKSFMSQCHVPAVLLNTGNIFETDDAAEMLRLLSGILVPGRPDVTRGALTTVLMGGTGSEWVADQSDADTWEDRVDAFQEYHRLWSSYGFIQMFRDLMAREKIRERLLGLPDGERRLTNVLHLAEILHREALSRHSGMTGIVNWLKQQMNVRSRRTEEHQLRLESDSDAVRIVTVHGSKGLEFPIVFCPFMWDGVDMSAEDIWFHDPARNFRVTLDLGSDHVDHHRLAARTETLAENLRLLYVALTRAKYRCYTAWGRIHQAETAALAYLIHGNGLSRHTDPVTAMARQMQEISDEHFSKDIHRLVRRGEGHITTKRIESNPARSRRATETPTPVLNRRSFRTAIDGSWNITSYTGLMRHGDRDGTHRGDHLPDHDAQTIRVSSGTTSSSVSLNEPQGIGAFPAGARAGAFFHDVLEYLDFTSRDRDAQGKLISEKLTLHGFDPGWLAAIQSSIENVISVRLEEGVSLSSVSKDTRISELGFYYPLNRTTPKDLVAIFSQTGDDRLPPGVSEALGRLRFSTTRGFMRGFIDLVFQQGGRYYLLDWKSNRLGTDPAAYGPDTLARVMAEENYFLQYHVYVMALHLYLQRRVPEYQYETHFGAVYYVFLRGLDPQREPGWGVYRARPTSALIENLVKALLP